MKPVVLITITLTFNFRWLNQLMIMIV